MPPPSGGPAGRSAQQRKAPQLLDGLFYVERAGGYDRIYGSLGVVVGLMTWAWLSSVAVLAGAALNAELEREAAV